MNELQIHLFFNHAPIIGVMAATLVVIIGIVLKQSAVRATGLAIYVLFALAVIPTYVSGEGAEERVENIAGINEPAIETHEDMALISLWFTLVAAAVGAGAFVAQWKNLSSAKALTLLFVVLAIAANIQIGITGHEGGKIRRPDLGTAQVAGGEEEHH
jgi:Ca2+/Na+ antiporter